MRKVSVSASSCTSSCAPSVRGGMAGRVAVAVPTSPTKRHRCSAWIMPFLHRHRVHQEGGGAGNYRWAWFIRACKQRPLVTVLRMRTDRHLVANVPSIQQHGKKIAVPWLVWCRQIPACKQSQTKLMIGCGPQNSWLY